MPEELRRAHSRIAELEAEIAALRTAQAQTTLFGHLENGHSASSTAPARTSGANSPEAFAQPASSILESITDAFLAVDGEFRYVWVNAEAERLFGTPREQMVGRVMWHVFPDLAASNVHERLHQSLAEQTPLDFETCYPSWDRWFFVKVYPTKEGGLSLYAREITEQKRAEKGLRDSEERLRLAFQAAEEIVYDWSPRKHIVQRDGSLERMLGVTAQEADATEQWWQERVHPEDADESPAKLIGRLGREQNSFETEFRVRHALGHWVHVRDRGFIIRDENGDPVRVVGSSLDLTARRRLEQELKESNEQLKFQADILAVTDDAVIALNSNRLIRYCNAGAERMYGMRCADVMGKPLSAIHPLLQFGLESDATRGESKHFRSDGTPFVVNCTVNRLSPESGGGVVAVVRDISEQRRAEMETQSHIRSHALQLSRANEDLLHFAYAASHDLQTPLRTVKSFAQLLALRYKTKLDSQGAEFIRWIVDGSSRMDTMLHDLLQFAKVAGGEAEFKEDVSLEQALATALESLRSTVEETQAVITHDSLPAVAGDAGQFAQLFQNLIGNSLKYRKPESTPEIHISAARNETDWVITVKDNGIGFKPEYAERIFGVFQRLHKDEFAGTGIGLSICKRIVERRGGRIWATAEPDQGASFSFSIPAEAAAGRERTESQHSIQRLIESESPSSGETNSSLSHFDELFHTLALAQAIVRDLDGTIQIWTSGSERLFGWPESEARGKRLHEFIGTESATSRSEMEAALLRKGEWTGELKAHKRDGGVIWLASHCALYRDGSGRPQSVIEVHNDITALKEAQTALLRSSEQRDLALDAGHMGIWRWATRTGVVEWSASLEALLGMKTGSFSGTYEALQELVHPEDRNALHERIANAFQNGPYYTVENRLRKSDGSYLWVRGQGTVIYDEDDQPAGLMGVVWDISERKQSEADRQFLLDLSAMLSRCPDADQLAEMAVTAVAKYFGALRCVYAEVDHAANILYNRSQYCTEGAPVPRKRALSEHDGLLAHMAANSFVAIGNAETDPRTAASYARVHAPAGTRAFLSVPLRREGTWSAAFTIGSKTVRTWQEREITLLRQAAERFWPALENARLLQEAREKQEQFQGTFEQAAVGMAHVGLDGQWLRVNERICEITGYSKEELLAARFQDITHPDDLVIDLEQYQALQRGEIPSYSMEKRYFHKSGEIVWIKLTVSIRRGSGAEYAISVIEDITASKKTAWELATSHSLAALRLREIEAIYSQAPVGLLFLDTDLRFVRINDHLAKQNGVTVADHLGRTVAEVLPQVGGWLEPMLRKVMETRQPMMDVELRGPAVEGSEGETIWLVSYFPLEGSDGAVLGLNGVVQDITERKRAETTLVETAERLKLATSAAQLGVFVWDARQDLAYWENQRMYEILGRNREDGPVNNREFLESVALPEDAAAHAKAVSRSMHSGEPFVHACRIRRGDGAIRWVEFSGQFEMDSDGKPLRLTGVMADITERLEAERLLLERK